MLLLAFGMATAGADTVTANGEAPASAVSAERRPQNNSCIQRDDEGRFLGWLDQTHCLVTLRADATAQWLDDRFSDEAESTEASTLIRFVEDTVWDAETGTSVRPRLNARLRLPGLDRRFHLVISGEDGQELGQPARPSPVERGSSIALRWLALVRAQTRLDFDLGARNTPDVFARARGVERIPLTEKAVLRLEQRYVYALRDQGSALFSADVERLLDENSVLRWAQGLRWREKETAVGFRWGEGLYLAHQFPQRRSSLQYGLEVGGVTHPDWVGESWGGVLLYRWSWWRPWLFSELEPRRTWHRELGWKPVNSVEFRIEVLFGH